MSQWLDYSTTSTDKCGWTERVRSPVFTTFQPTYRHSLWAEPITRRFINRPTSHYIQFTFGDDEWTAKLKCGHKFRIGIDMSTSSFLLQPGLRTNIPSANTMSELHVFLWRRGRYYGRKWLMRVHSTLSQDELYLSSSPLVVIYIRGQVRDRVRRLCTEHCGRVRVAVDVFRSAVWYGQFAVLASEFNALLI